MDYLIRTIAFQNVIVLILKTKNWGTLTFIGSRSIIMQQITQQVYRKSIFRKLKDLIQFTVSNSKQFFGFQFPVIKCQEEVPRLVFVLCLNISFFKMIFVTSTITDILGLRMSVMEKLPVRAFPRDFLGKMYCISVLDENFAQKKVLKQCWIAICCMVPFSRRWISPWKLGTT